ncbi:MAG TPA: hypothetical protein VIV11_29695 [Kofleriaceae bacterium]
MKPFFAIALLVLVGCGHRAELELVHVKATGGVVELDVLCKREVGTTCASAGALCVTADWIYQAKLLYTAKECRPNTLREGDTLPVRLVTTENIPAGSDVTLAVTVADPNAAKGVHKLPRISVKTN